MGAVFAIIAGINFWFPLLFGIQINEKLLKRQFFSIFIGVNLTFFPQHFLGLNGIPRRYSEYSDFFFNFNVIRSIGSLISSIAIIKFLFLIWESFSCNRIIIYIDFQNSINEFLNNIIPSDHTFDQTRIILK
jgi:heme/copper-type cytochrome/quinol oxidase subunit 1